MSAVVSLISILFQELKNNGIFREIQGPEELHESKRMHNFRQTITCPIVRPGTKFLIKLFLFGVHNAAWFGSPFGVMHSSVRVQKGCSASASSRGQDCEDLPLEIYCWTHSILCRNEVEFPECCRSSA